MVYKHQDPGSQGPGVVPMYWGKLQSATRSEEESPFKVHKATVCVVTQIPMANRRTRIALSTAMCLEHTLALGPGASCPDLGGEREGLVTAAGALQRRSQQAATWPGSSRHNARTHLRPVRTALPHRLEVWACARFPD